MNKKEAIRAMLDGKKVYRPSGFATGVSLRYDERAGKQQLEGIFVDHNGDPVNPLGMASDGWELYEGYTYPMWFKSKAYGSIVKFTGLGTGEVVLKGTGIYEVGYTSDGWVPHTLRNAWSQVEEPKPIRTVTIEKWLWTDGEGKYWTTEGNNPLPSLPTFTRVKLLDSYMVELPND